MTASPELITLLRRRDALNAAAAQARLARARPPARRRAPVPEAPPRAGLTWEQSQALIAELDRLEERAAKALDRLANGQAVNGGTQLRHIYNGARDSARWARQHLQDANPDVEFLDR